jgi:hypothetical protein
MMSVTTQTASQIETSDEMADPAAVAGLIHNDVLQSLAVAVLGVDLCRRFHQRMRYEQALDEIVAIGEALSLALASSENLLPDLDRLLPTARPASARPSLMVLDAAANAANAASDRQTAGPREIVDTLAACQIQARRCRGQYDAGLGEETMRDLELMLQRLEFISVAFRAVMGQLREIAGRSEMPQLPQPQAMPARPAVVSWIRSA